MRPARTGGKRGGNASLVSSAHLTDLKSMAIDAMQRNDEAPRFASSNACVNDGAKLHPAALEGHGET